MVLHIQLGIGSTGFTSNNFKYDEHYLKLDAFLLSCEYICIYIER